jgi:hypothetical protein
VEEVYIDEYSGGLLVFHGPFFESYDSIWVMESSSLTTFPFNNYQVLTKKWCPAFEDKCLAIAGQSNV